MTAQERAEKIVDTLAKVSNWRDDIDFIAAQIEAAEREAVTSSKDYSEFVDSFTQRLNQISGLELDYAKQKGFSEGFSAAKEKAVAIFTEHYPEERLIARCISKMTPDSNETPQSGGGRMTP